MGDTKNILCKSKKLKNCMNSLVRPKLEYCIQPFCVKYEVRVTKLGSTTLEMKVGSCIQCIGAYLVGHSKGSISVGQKCIIPP